MNKKNEEKCDNSGMIMIQGCSSNSGKSTVATALCRIYSKKDLKVAPFKGWNMGINSAFTSKGKEIGVAQYLQAKAAGVEATANMQPLLVKVKAGAKSEVVVKGKEYFKSNEIKKEDYLEIGMEIIEESIAKLKEKFEVLVLEGSGSPVEINVKDKDLANMKTALINKTPVILVADISRGGVFASIVGTMELLEAKEKELIAGFIINKFHGNKAVLKSGIDYIEKRTGKSVLGVLPYIEDINLPEEDTIALSEEEKADLQSKKGEDSKNEDFEKSFNKLAKIFKENIDMEKVDEIVF